MTLPASPQQNSIAERINGIIKNEWIYDMKLDSCSTAQKELKEIIRIYNEHRPHQTLEFATPNDIHTEVLIRHQVKRVIGKTYPKKRLCLKKTQSNAIDPQLSLVGCSSAEPTSVSLRQNNSNLKMTKTEF